MLSIRFRFRVNNCLQFFQQTLIVFFLQFYFNFYLLFSVFLVLVPVDCYDDVMKDTLCTLEVYRFTAVGSLELFF